MHVEMERTQEAGLRVQLLSEFRVWAGAWAIPGVAWRRRKPAALVKLLALAPDHRLHREEVLELLWPGLIPDARENNLHRTLHLARHTLEPNRPAGTQSRYLALHRDLVVL